MINIKCSVSKAKWRENIPGSLHRNLHPFEHGSRNLCLEGKSLAFHPLEDSPSLQRVSPLGMKQDKSGEFG